jgi:hypothetical protein
MNSMMARMLFALCLGVAMVGCAANPRAPSADGGNGGYTNASHRVSDAFPRPLYTED